MAFYCNGKKDICECDILCADCQHYDNTGGKKWQTNADLIRAMSDEELARFLAENEWECETYNDCAKCPRMTDDGCVSLLKWLKQPVEDNDYDNT